jgi:protein TonB
VRKEIALNFSTKIPPVVSIAGVPSAPSGWYIDTFLANNLRYPPGAERKGITGRVVVKFVVEADGSLTNFEVESSPDADLADEALRVVKLMPKWHPATDGYKPIKVTFRIPIVFKL